MLLLLYAPTLYFSTAALIAVAVYAWRRSDVPGSRAYAAVLLAAAWWGLMTALETEAPVEGTKLLLRQLGWIGILSINVLHLSFLALYLREDRLLARRLRLLWVVSALLLGALFTNPWHHLFFTGYNVIEPPGITALEPGPLLVVSIVYIMLLGVVSALWLAQAAQRAHDAERRRFLLLLAAALAPSPFIAAFWFRLTPFDLTPVSFLLVAALIALAIYRYRLFSLLPVAQEMILRNLQDGYLLLDTQNRVVASNPAWAKLFDGVQPLPGQPSAQRYADYPQVLRAMTETVDWREIEIGDPNPRTIELQSSPVLDQQGHPQGRVVVARDITVRKTAAGILADNERALAVAAARRRFDQELKDSLTQVLRFVRGQITQASDLLARGELALASGLLARLDAIAADTDTNILDTLSQGAGVPAHADFYQALRLYTRDFAQVSGIYVALSLPEVPASVHLLPVVQVQVMRIIQETLNRIRELGNAHTAQIIFARQDAEVQITIAADASLFDLQDPTQTGTELSNLSDRVAAIGGRLHVDTLLGQGTTIRIHLAVAAPEAGRGPLADLRVVLAEPQSLILEGLRQILAGHGVDIVGEARDGATAAHLCATRHPDLVLLDLKLPRLSGAEAAARINAESPEVRCVILADSLDDADVTRALQSGVAGYLLKSQGLADFVEAMVRLRNGERVFVPEVAARLASLVAAGPKPEENLTERLTPQQADILRMVAEGLTYKEVGARMHITERTVRYHMEHILDALELPSRSKAIAFAYRVGLARDRRRAPRPEPDASRPAG